MNLFSQSAQAMRSSEIRRLMKLAADPSIISFAGGMPNNALFPVEEVEALMTNLDKAEKQRAFQYGPTQGYPPLLAQLKRFLGSRGLPVDSNELIITTGAQQGLNLAAKVFLDPGDTVLTEYPSFIGALAAFKSYGATMTGCAMDNEGIIPEELEQALRNHPAAKLLYLNPNFQNPGGSRYTLARKRKVLELLRDRSIVLLEDDPYAELYFDDADAHELTPCITLAAGGPTPVLYAGSFAKILGPGMRLGWLLGPPEIIDKCELAKQSMDACSSTYTQVLAKEFLAHDRLEPYLARLRPVYARRAKLMLDALAAGMPPGVSWSTPKGGFYIWVTLPEETDATAVFEKALSRGTAFVVGSAFDPQGSRNDCFRLAFSHTPEDQIARGTALVCEAVREVLEA